MDVESPKYAIKNTIGWEDDMIGTESTGSNLKGYAGTLGFPITNFTVASKNIKKARVRNKRGRWLSYSDEYDKTSGFGDDTNISGIEIVGAGYMVAVHCYGGGWMTPVYTSDVEGEVLIGVGFIIDGIWITKA